MACRREKMPRSASNLRIKRAADRLSQMPMTDRIQLRVKANLMTQEETDRAKAQVLAAEQGAAE